MDSVGAHKSPYLADRHDPLVVIGYVNVGDPIGMTLIQNES
jgi:hypothetical protein